MAAQQSMLGGPKKAKYKTQVMALLTMMQLSAVEGNHDEVEYFLAETEKLIRLRGLNRHKSRKVRLLHHCYTYERIFFETTSTGGPFTSGYSRDVHAVLQSAGAIAYSKDSVSFSRPALENLESLEQDVLQFKDQELGENDLHLQLPGLWPPSQYLEIFGVPEKYIFVVSLIIRLARERDGEVEDDQPGNLSVKAFTMRARAIERCIKQLRQSDAPLGTNAKQLSRAVHNALAIFFYRRIHGVDSCMLQEQVSNVRDALMLHDSTQQIEGTASMRLIWPAFIAACETEDTSTRTFVATWFEKASRQHGFKLFDITMANIERVWQDKQSGLPTRPTYLRDALLMHKHTAIVPAHG